MICPTQNRNAEVLLDYCAGTLEPARAAEFATHIDACGDCRRVVETQRQVWGALDAWTPLEVSPDFDARLYARIAREQAAPQWRRWFWKPAVPLALACAVLAVGFLVRTPNEDKLDIQQVERTLEDLDMLTPLS